MPPRYLLRPAFLLLLAYAGGVAFWRSRGGLEPPSRPREWRAPQLARVSALIVSPARRDPTGWKFTARAGEGRRAVRLQVYAPKGMERLPLPGELWEFRGRVRGGRPARNPGEFDEREFLAQRGISGVLRAESARRLESPLPWSWLLRNAAERARRSIESCFERLLPEDEARVMAGLTMGYKGKLRPELNRAVQDAGAAHLLTPSGAKVGLVLACAAALARALSLWPWARFGFAAATAGFYTLIVGADAPYLRAYLAALAFYAGFLLGRESGAFQATVLSALAILLWEPRELFGAGFQMTYAAMAGLLVALPGVERLLPRRRWARAAVAAGLITFVVQAALWPVFANVFGRTSLAGGLANIVLVPSSGPLSLAGFGLWGVSQISEGVGLWAAGLVRAGAAAFIRVCQFFARLPGAATELAPMRPAEIAAFYLMLYGLFWWPRPRFAAALLAAGLAVGGAQAALARGREPALRVIYLREPQRAALVSFPGGRHWLIGAQGPAGNIVRAARVYRIGRFEKVLPLGRPGELLCVRTLAKWGRVGALEPPAPGRRLAALCEGQVCFQFDPPRVLRGDAEFSILPSFLKRSAVEVATDGVNVEIRTLGPAKHQLRSPLL